MEKKRTIANNWNEKEKAVFINAAKNHMQTIEKKCVIANRMKDDAWRKIQKDMLHEGVAQLDIVRQVSAEYDTHISPTGFEQIEEVSEMYSMSAKFIFECAVAKLAFLIILTDAYDFVDVKVLVDLILGLLELCTEARFCGVVKFSFEFESVFSSSSPEWLLSVNILAFSTYCKASLNERSPCGRCGGILHLLGAIPRAAPTSCAWRYATT
ncbi:Pyrokinin 2 receptor 2 [Carabus blaptoides fortunei]